LIALMVVVADEGFVPHRPAYQPSLHREALSCSSQQHYGSTHRQVYGSVCLEGAGRVKTGRSLRVAPNAIKRKNLPFTATVPTEEKGF
ncbi:hypothetical protein N8388_08450, partial [Octadecabacter sp.]|nr:hypothetical protein [Octadecabacter sp.]